MKKIDIVLIILLLIEFCVGALKGFDWLVVSAIIASALSLGLSAINQKTR